MADLTSNEQTGMKDSTMETDVKEQVKSLSGAADKNPIQVAGRVFGALEYLTSAGTAGLMEISTALGLNKSTTRRVLCSLEYMGYVRQNELTGRYEPTFKIVDLAGRVLQKLDIIELVRPGRRGCNLRRQGGSLSLQFPDGVAHRQQYSVLQIRGWKSACRAHEPRRGPDPVEHVPDRTDDTVHDH